MEQSPGPAYVGLAPMLPVTDVRRTIRFYEQIGFTVGNTHTPEGAEEPVWAWLFNGPAHVMVNRADGTVDATHASASLWVYSRDVSATHALLGSRGVDVGDITYPPYNAGGEFHVHDPDGYAVFIAQAE